MQIFILGLAMSTAVQCLDLVKMKVAEYNIRYP